MGALTLLPKEIQYLYILFFIFESKIILWIYYIYIYTHTISNIHVFDSKYVVFKKGKEASTRGER